MEGWSRNALSLMNIKLRAHIQNGGDDSARKTKA
jgi:hypothetical protein